MLYNRAAIAFHTVVLKWHSFALTRRMLFEGLPLIL